MSRMDRLFPVHYRMMTVSEWDAIGVQTLNALYGDGFEQRAKALMRNRRFALYDAAKSPIDYTCVAVSDDMIWPAGDYTITDAHGCYHTLSVNNLGALTENGKYSEENPR